MYRFAREDLDLEQLRDRLLRMPDEELVRFGKGGCLYVLAAGQHREAAAADLRPAAERGPGGVAAPASAEERK